MTDRPLVSVVVPTYKRWDLLPDALRSLQAQTWPAWEAIVVNDGGGPPQEDAAVLLGDPRFKYLEHSQNRGLATARNTGLAHAAGELIAYLDDDDIFHPDHLEAAASALQSHALDVVYTNARRATCAVTGGVCRVLSAVDLVLPEFDPARFWKGNFIPVLCVVHRRACLDHAGRFDPRLRILEDWDLWLRLAARYRFHHLPQITCEVRIRGDGTNMMERENRRLDAEVKAQIYLKYLEEPTLAQHPGFETHLRGGIAWLVRCHRGWFAGQLATREGASRFWPLYAALPRYEKVRLLASRPLALLRAGRRTAPGLPGRARHPGNECVADGRPDDLEGSGATGLDSGLVSVIMPAYNAERHIRAAIASVTGQTYADWELIVVDDGSTDHTAEIVRAVSASDARIRYYHQPNGKQARARNRAIAESRGRYLAFLDADDLWVPEKLEKQVRCIRRESVDLVFSDSSIVGDDGSETGRTMNTCKGRISGEKALTLFFRINRIPILTVLVARDSVQAVDGFSEDPDLQNAEDYRLWLELLLHGATMYGLAEPLASYRVHASQSTGADERATLRAINALSSLQLPDQRLSRLRNQGLVHWYHRACYQRYFTGPGRQAQGLHRLLLRIRQYSRFVVAAACLLLLPRSGARVAQRTIGPGLTPRATTGAVGGARRDSEPD